MSDQAEIIECVSPIDGTIYASREVASTDAAHAAVTKARGASASWAATPVAERAKLVMNGVAALAATSDEAVPELAHMMGRPVRYGGEFAGVQERAQYMAQIASQALADVEVGEDAGIARYIKRIPQGLVLVIAPWNYPYLTAINTVAPALIAGNTVLLKHSAQTLLAGERMESAFLAAGMPQDVFRNVFLSHATTLELIGQRSFDMVNFTGSVSAGQAIERAAAGTFAAVGTELGGKDPGYVMEDADVKVAADTLIDAAMFNSGQCCCAIERIYVHKSVFKDFLERAVNITKGYKLGNPLDSETDIGPMAQASQAQFVRTQIAQALDAGATSHIDSAPQDGGSYLTPQVLSGVTHDMDVMREESFGPVIGIMEVSDDEQAVQLMNDSCYGLTCSLWTKDLERAQRIGDKVETGTVFMNRADYLDPALCWTGCKNTGRGASLSELGYQSLTRPKSYHLKKSST